MLHIGHKEMHHNTTGIDWHHMTLHILSLQKCNLVCPSTSFQQCEHIGH